MTSAASARAATVSRDSLGVNLRLFTANNQLQPGNLPVASASGLGVARVPVNEGSDIDSVVRLTAAAHLRLYAELGLPTAETPAAAASDMAQYITTFAKRYGPGGSFWSQNPQLPYMPVQSFEIGNEPNLPVYWVDDTTHLHWANPASYAQVYAAARAALHQVDPSGIAVVGGLADSARLGVDVPNDEKWLAALRSTPVDAVGYHPYTYYVSNSLMKTDTAALRQWMNANGLAGAPLDVNEFGACEITSKTTDNSRCQVPQTSAQWGAVATSYTQWALCSPQLNVEQVQTFYWGATARTDADVWMPLMSGAQTLTPLGRAYLGLAQSLTSSGCPAMAPQVWSAPTIQGGSTIGARLSAGPGWWTGNPAPTFSYQWQRCDRNGHSCSNIAGATSTNYTVQAADAGATISVAVSAANAGGTAAAAAAPTAAVDSGQTAPSTTTTTTTTATATATTTSAAVPPPSSTASARLLAANLMARKHATLSVLRIRAVSIRRHGRRLDVTVRYDLGVGRVKVGAYGRRHHVRLRAGHSRSRTVAKFTVKLTRGRWKLIVSAAAGRGYPLPAPVQRKVTIFR